MFVVQYIFCRARGNNKPLANDVGLFADIQRIAHIVIGDEYADATITQVIYDFFDVAD